MRPVTITVAWLCATAAAVGVSWLGVRTVMQDTALPLPQVTLPVSTMTSGPLPAPPQSLTTNIDVPPATSTTAPTTTPAHSTAPATTTTPPPTTGSTETGAVQRYSTPGGQVVLNQTPTSATLVSATPADGYSVQDWQETDWLRVDFTSGNTTYSLIASWNGHAPTVQTFQS